MAINLDERYPGRANPKTLSYPQGSFKNRTSPTSKDGTYLEQDWANDWAGFFQRMMVVSGISPNGAVDTAESSQYFDALSKIISDATPDASTTKKGLVELATTAQAQALTNDATVITPKKLADAFSGPNRGMGTGSKYQILPGVGERIAIQAFSVLLTPTGGGIPVGGMQTFNVDYPIAFSPNESAEKLILTATSRVSGVALNFQGSSRFPYGETIGVNNLRPGVLSGPFSVSIIAIGEV